MDRKARIFAKRQHQQFNIEEWGEDGKCSIRQISGAERARIVQAHDEDKDKYRPHANAIMVLVFLGDENGQNFFDDSDIEKIKGLPATIQDKIVKAGLTFNLMTKEGAEAEKKA